MGRTLHVWEWGSCISLTTFPQSPSALPTCICMCGMLRAHVKIHPRSWIPPHFILVTVLEMSDVMPVAMPHPIFLDMESKETMDKTGKPLAPLWFRGFRLHTVWSRPPGGEPVHQIAFPHLRGEATTPMLEYEPERLPQSMRQGSKMSITLRPPSSEHWNIKSDLMLTVTMGTYKQRREAKRAEQDPEWESAGAKVSPKEALVLVKALQAVASDSRAVSPTETTCQGERDLEITLGIVECIHALRLQIIHEMGGVREVEQAAVCTLMAEFARLQTCAKTSPRVYQLYTRRWRPPVRFCQLA